MTCREWQEVTLRDVCDFQYGKSLPEAARQPGPFPVFGSNGQVGTHDQALSSGPTIIIGRKGSLGAVNYSNSGCWPIDTTYYVDATTTSADVRWLAYQLASLGLNRLNRAAAVPGLNRADAYRLRLLLPPVDQQRRIADILDKADALRAKRRAALAQLDALNEAIFLNMFGDPAHNDQPWPSAPLRNLVEEFRYGTSVKSGTTGRPVLRIPNIVRGTLDLTNLKRVAISAAESKRLVLRSGDILFVRTNGNREFVGRCAVFDPDRQKHPEASEFVFASYLIRARLQPGVVHPVYLREFLRTAEGRRRLFARGKTSAGQYNISTEGLGEIGIPLPPVEAQQSFAERVREVEVLADANIQSLNCLDALFASLQHRAFRGEL